MRGSNEEGVNFRWSLKIEDSCHRPVDRLER